MTLASRIAALARLCRDPYARREYAWFSAMEENDARAIAELLARDRRAEHYATHFALREIDAAPEEVRRAGRTYFRWLRERALGLRPFSERPKDARPE